VEDETPDLELLPSEYVCQNDGCWLVHLRAASAVACDSPPA
jgi:hypothetical protein